MATGTKLRVRIIDRAGGLSYAKIAEALRISKQTAVDIVRDNLDQVATLQARLREEIEQRELSQIHTDKLITLFIKTTQALKEEVYTPEAKSSSEQTKDAQERSLYNWAGW